MLSGQTIAEREAARNRSRLGKPLCRTAEAEGKRKWAAKRGLEATLLGIPTRLLLIP